MNMEQIRRVARDKGLKPGKLKKIELVHLIQVEEGNFDCYGTAYEEDCDQQACAWRDDCFVEARRANGKAKAA